MQNPKQTDHNFALLQRDGETVSSRTSSPNVYVVRSDRRVSQSHAQGDPQYSARTLFALSHSEYPFHCRRERSFDRKHPRVSQGVSRSLFRDSGEEGGGKENTTPQAGNIARNDVINDLDCRGCLETTRI